MNVLPSSHAESMAALRRILKSAPQDLWLDTIRRTKTGAHNELIHWMLGQPECDFSVAAHAFYHSDPTVHLDDPQPLPPRPDASQIFAQILLNWDTGFYRIHKLQLEPGDVDTRLVSRLNQKMLAWPKGALPFNIPSRLLQIKGGEPVDLPQYLSPDHAGHLRPIYRALDLGLRPAPVGLGRRVAKARKIFNRVAFRSARL